MPDQQVIPDTENISIAVLAVAWDIVKHTQNIANDHSGPDQRLQNVTNAVLKAYTALSTQKPIEKSS
jgi:hypothetical protein